MRLSWALPLIFFLAQGDILGASSETTEVLVEEKLSGGVHRSRPNERYRRKPHIHLFHRSHDKENTELEEKRKHDLAHDLTRLGQDLLFLGPGHHPGHVVEDLKNIGQDIVQSDLAHDVVNLGKDLFFLGKDHHPGHVLKDLQDIGHDLLHIGEQGPSLHKLKPSTKEVTSISSTSDLEKLSFAKGSENKPEENNTVAPVSPVSPVLPDLNSFQNPEKHQPNSFDSTPSTSHSEKTSTISESDSLKTKNVTPISAAQEIPINPIDITQFTMLPNQPQPENTTPNDLKSNEETLKSELDTLLTIIRDETLEEASSALQNISFHPYFYSNRQHLLENELTTLINLSNSVTNSLSDLFTRASKTRLAIYRPMIDKLYNMWQTSGSSLDRSLLFAKTPRDILSSMKVLSPSDINTISLNQKMSLFQLGRATGQIQALNEAIYKFNTTIAPESVAQVLAEYGSITLPDLRVPFLIQRPSIPLLEVKSTLVQPAVMSSLNNQISKLLE